MEYVTCLHFFGRRYRDTLSAYLLGTCIALQAIGYPPSIISRFARAHLN